MRLAFRLAGLLAASLLLASCGIFGDKEDELEPKELVDFEPSIKVKRVWSAKLGGEAEHLRVALQPIGDGSRIYGASFDGNVTAFDARTGKQAWRNKLKVELSAGPGVGEGRVIVATKDGLAILLDAATGAEQWRTNIDGESLARPLISGNFVVVQTIDNRLLALSVFDGRQVWSIEQSTPSLTQRGSASPVLVGSVVIAGFDNGRMTAVDLDSGDVVWEAMLAPPTGRSVLDRLADVDGAIAAVGQDIYAAGYQGRLAAMASESGQILWSREISSYVGVAVDWNSVYTTRDDGEIIAMARRDGAETWRNNDLLRRLPTLPTSFNTTVAVGDLEGYVHFFSNLTGEPVARVKLGGTAISNAPVVIADRLYVQSDSGNIAAYEIVQDRPSRSAPDISDDS